MSSGSSIEWTDATWNPIVGCSIVSPGCTNCYAMKMAARVETMRSSHYDGTTKKVNGNAVWTGNVALAPDSILQAPLRWKKPRRIFVNSMGDLFHESIPDEWIDRVFAVMALCPQHTFQVLTKRAKRMRDYVTWERSPTGITRQGAIRHQTDVMLAREDRLTERLNYLMTWPLPTVWLGVSCERQQEADERIPLLLQTPAAIRFISAEPLLGPIDLLAKPRSESALGFIDWVIVGGESGHGARPMELPWARDLRDQCNAGGVPFFFKQFGEWAPGDGDCVGQQYYKVGKKAAGRQLDGREWNEFPQVSA